MKMIFVLLVIFLFKIVIILAEKIIDPSLKPANPFSVEKDAEVLFKEISQDNFTDDDKVAKIWFRRTLDQRQQIADYHWEHFCKPMLESHREIENYGCPLKEGLEHESSILNFNLYDLYSQSLTEPESILASTARNALKGSYKEVGAIEEILCANNKEVKDKMDEFYKSLYEVSVEDDLKLFRKEDQEYQHVMVQYCWKGLCQEQKIKPEDAEKEAQALRAINPETDKENFINKLKELLDKNGEPDMKLIFQKYRTEKNGISDAVDKAFKVKRVKRAFNRLVRHLEDPCKFYADELNEALDGWGTNEDKITRIVLTRCEKDLGCILKKYKESHNQSFTKRLLTDTLREGRYRNCIQYLCGE